MGVNVRLLVSILTGHLLLESYDLRLCLIYDNRFKGFGTNKETMEYILCEYPAFVNLLRCLLEIGLLPNFEATAKKKAHAVIPVWQENYYVFQYCSCSQG